MAGKVSSDQGLRADAAASLPLKNGMEITENPRRTSNDGECITSDGPSDWPAWPLAVSRRFLDGPVWCAMIGPSASRTRQGQATRAAVAQAHGRSDGGEGRRGSQEWGKEHRDGHGAFHSQSATGRRASEREAKPEPPVDLRNPRTVEMNKVDLGLERAQMASCSHQAVKQDSKPCHLRREPSSSPANIGTLPCLPRCQFRRPWYLLAWLGPGPE